MKTINFVVVLAAVSFLTACDPKGAFLGVYKVTGTAMVSMQGQGNNTQQFSQSAEIVDGTDDEILFPLNNECLIPLRVEGQVATLVSSGATCTFHVQSATLDYKFTTATAMQAGDSITLSLSANTTATGEGRSVTGTYQMNANLNRIGY